ncbi:SIR2 family protein [Paraconexibacter algicola]|uniref:SIR2 family protein n=1 Tax=Paraconexibacter algicola TaxID=2133960 RepID=UPI001304A843|nr:SIR2 family protein [Paraconexibacter algicola]
MDEVLGAEPLPTDDPMARALVQVPSRFIVTLNYDLLLEATADALGIRHRVLSNTKSELKEAHRLLAREAWPLGELTILHLHGMVGRPETLVLDADSYSDLMSMAGQKEVLRELLVHRRMAFYGTTLNETYFLEACQRQLNSADHVLVCADHEVETVKGGRLSISYPRHHIRIKTVRSHSELPDDVALLTTRAEPQIGRRAVTGALERSGLHRYIPNEFADLRNPITEDQRVKAWVEDEIDAFDEPNEDDILVGHRTLVVGDVGVGKSELIEELTANPRANRPTVLVRLGNLRFAGGQLSRVLQTWAQSAVSAHGGVDVSLDAVEAGGLHFLLDGLDEVPASEQATAGRLIRQVAAGHPQHAFTVTSRPSAASAEFQTSGDEWAVLQLAPSRIWQERFLHAQQVDLATLRGEMDELDDLDELLTTPFFLARIVELHRANRLAGLSDLGTLLEEMISWQLDREDDLLDVDLTDVRRWLQEVALFGLIFSKRGFTSGELRCFTLPPGTYGGLDGLTEALVHRLLLSEAEDGYRFPQRILGEQLAAERLVGLEPGEALLGALVPRAAADVGAVREDALLSVTLACRRSKVWRKAVADRDPMAAAVATPRGASEGERDTAALSIWRTYSEWRIWMWSRGRSSVLDHAASLGRLVAGRSRCAPARLLQGAMRGGGREEQGNAIRALAISPPPNFISELRAVLEDPTRDGVVLRQAAIAAEDLGYVDLLDALLVLVETALDDTVKQTAGASVIQLTPEERLVEVGRRLARTTEADLSLIRLADRLSSSGLVLVAGSTVANDEPRLPDRVRRRIAEAVTDVGPDPGAEVAEASAYAIVVHRLDAAIAEAIAERQPEAMMRGVSRAVADGVDDWEAIQLGSYLPRETLERAGFDPRLVEYAQRAREARASPPPGSRVQQVPAEPAASEEVSLAGLLANDSAAGSDLLLREYRRLAPQVAQLSDPLREQLAHVVERWRPEIPYRETITFIQRRHWNQWVSAAAWAAYSARLRADIDPSTWAQIATCGVVFGPEHEWLRATATDDGQVEAACLLEGETDPEFWLDIFQSCEPPYAPRLLRSACANLEGGRADDVPENEDRIACRRLVEIFVDAQEHALAARLAQRRPALQGDLDALFARGGDLPAQLRLLPDLVARAERGERLSDEDVQWMSGVTHADALPPLFRVLAAVWVTQSGPVPRFSSGSSPRDLTSPVIEAIARIGGIAAVRGYDELLERGDDLRWLRSPRDQVLARLLATIAEPLAAAAASAAGLPELSAED